ncbi:MAG: carbohydrate ABC transporter permease [Thermomicrobiales bacterium]
MVATRTPLGTDAAKRWRRPSGVMIVLWLLGMLVVLAWAAPFIWMVSTSVKLPGQIMTRDIEWIPRQVTGENYAKVFEQPIWRWLTNSLIVASIATIVSLLSGALAGYAFARLHFPGRNILFFFVLMTLMIPAEMTIVPLFIGFLRAELVDRYIAFILPSIASVFSVYLFRQFFMSLPRALEDAARVDGAGRFRIFFTIALPLAKPAVIAAGILLFTTNWNAFLWPLLVAFSDDMKTLPVGMATFSPGVGGNTQIQSFGPAMAAVTILTIPSLLVFLVLQRYFIQGVTSAGLKG